MVEILLFVTLILLVVLIIIYFCFYLDRHHDEMVDMFEETEREIKHLHDKIDYLHQKVEKAINPNKE